MIFLSNQRTTQPQVAVGIRRGNPLAEGLKSVVAAHCFDLTQDLASGGLPVTVTGTSSADFSSAGRGRRGGSGIYWRGSTNSIVDLSNAPFSVFILFVPRVVPVGNQGFFQIADSAASGSPSFLLQIDAALGIPRSYIGGYGYEDSSATVPVAVGVPMSIGFSYSAATHSLYQNGTELFVSATTLSAGETSKWWLGTGYPTEFDASYLLCLQWARTLSDREHLLLAKDPWRIFQPLPRTVWIGPPAGGVTAQIVATDSSDTAALVAANWRTAQIAAIESSDVAAITAGVTTGAAIAATESSDTAVIVASAITTAQIVVTESSDTAAIIAANWTKAQVAATESSDTAALTATVTTGAAIAATETPDTAAITASAFITAQIVATESSDTASVSAAVTTGAAIAATESSDTAAITASAFTDAQIAATEGSDNAAISATVTTGAEIVASDSSDTVSITADANLSVTSASIDATESSDSASVSASVTTGVVIAASESSDTASITADIIATAQIAATESSDTVSISAEATTSATIAATDSSDTAAIVADASGVLSASISATESSDTTAVSASVTTGAAIDATESPDSASIIGSGGAVDAGVSGPLQPRQRPTLAPIIGRIHTGQVQTVKATVTLKLVVSVKTAQVQSVEAIADQSIDVVSVTDQAHRITGFGWARMLTSARSAQATPLLVAMLTQEMRSNVVSGIFDRQVPIYEAPEWEMPIVFRDIA